jgi:hypothetical protein
LRDLSGFFNIPYERMNEIFKGICSEQKRPDEAMAVLKRRLNEGLK